MPLITYVGRSATMAVADNAAVTPSLPPGIAVGDLLVIQHVIRSGAGVSPTPTLWTAVSVNGGQTLSAREWDGVFAAPVITPTGGAAGDTHMARMAAFRGARRAGATAAGTSNAVQANVDKPALTIASDNQLTMCAISKAAAWTSAAIPAGHTEAWDDASTTGNDQSLQLSYQIQTTAANVSSGTLTITGGATAAGRGTTAAFDLIPTITVATQDVYPPRVLVSVSLIDVGDAIQVYRVVGGERTLIRGGADDSVSSTAFLRVDAELPFGVPVSYVIILNGVEYSTAPVTYALPGGKVVITDAVSGAAAEAVILAWPEKAYGRQSSTYQVGGRNVVVSGDMTDFQGQIELFTETTSTRDNVLDVVATATEGVVQIRQPGGYDGVDCYVFIRSVTERRFSQDGSDQRRRIMLEAVAVEPWADLLESPGFTLQDIADTYTPGVLDDIDNDYATLLALAQGDFS